MKINIPKDVGKPQSVPPGIYRVRVTGSKIRTSQSGNLCVGPELTIQNQGPDESVKTVGRKVFDNWTLAESSIGIVNTAYKALTGHDLPAGEFELDELANRITSDVLNREAIVEVVIAPDLNGVDRNSVKKWTKIEG